MKHRYNQIQLFALLNRLIKNNICIPLEHNIHVSWSGFLSVSSYESSALSLVNLGFGLPWATITSQVSLTSERSRGTAPGRKRAKNQSNACLVKNRIALTLSIQPSLRGYLVADNPSHCREDRSWTDRFPLGFYCIKRQGWITFVVETIVKHQIDGDGLVGRAIDSVLNFWAQMSLFCFFAIVRCCPEGYNIALSLNWVSV